MLCTFKLKPILLTAALIAGFASFLISPSSAENTDTNPASFSLIFSNNMAGDYKPCG